VSRRTHFEADIDLSHHPPLIGGHGAVLVQDRTHRRHCNGVPRKIFGSSGGSLFPTGETPSTGGHPYSTAADPELLNSVLRVLSCGPEWGRAESGMKKTLLFALALIAVGCADTEQSETPSDGSEQVAPFYEPCFDWVLSLSKVLNHPDR